MKRVKCSVITYTIRTYKLGGEQLSLLKGVRIPCIVVYYHASGTKVW